MFGANGNVGHDAVGLVVDQFFRRDEFDTEQATGGGLCGFGKMVGAVPLQISKLNWFLHQESDRSTIHVDGFDVVEPMTTIRWMLIPQVLEHRTHHPCVNHCHVVHSLPCVQW